MNNKYKSLIDVIGCFEDVNKFYWIEALHVPDSIKGFLISYFKLI